jgi:hypothetical protein
VIYLRTSNEIIIHSTRRNPPLSLFPVLVHISSCTSLSLLLFLSLLTSTFSPKNFPLGDGEYHNNSAPTTKMEQIPVSIPLVGGKKTKTASEHPLGPLTASEITQSSKIIKGLWPSATSLQFKSITLQEPNKADLVPYLTAEHSGKALPNVPRRSFVIYYIRNTVRFSPAYKPFCISPPI